MATAPDTAAHNAATSIDGAARLAHPPSDVNGNRITPPRITGSDAMKEYSAANSSTLPPEPPRCQPDLEMPKHRDVQAMPTAAWG